MVLKAGRNASTRVDQAMTDSEFDILASHTLHAIEVAIDAVAESADLDLDIQMKPGGILDIAFADGSRIIVNRQIGRAHV